MSTKRLKFTRQILIAFDLGGTKIECGLVLVELKIHPKKRGGSTKNTGSAKLSAEVLTKNREFLDLSDGKTSLLSQISRLTELSLSEAKRLRLKVVGIGFSSAGPLDPVKGELLDPTNFKTPKGPIGIVPIKASLEKKFRIPVYVENDAAAQILAEHAFGGQNFSDFMLLTLGTGLGTSVLINGKLLRASRHLHTEAGHISINAFDKLAPCGCGNFGCAEAYLSGRNASRRAMKYLDLGYDQNTSGETLVKLADKRNKKALIFFDQYAKEMAIALHAYVVLFSPKTFVFAGGFSSAFPFFYRQTVSELSHLLGRRRKPIDQMPKLKISKIKNKLGLLGGAVVAHLNITRQDY